MYHEDLMKSIEYLRAVRAVGGAKLLKVSGRSEGSLRISTPFARAAASHVAKQDGDTMVVRASWAMRWFRLVHRLAPAARHV